MPTDPGPSQPPSGITLAEAVPVWARIALLSFGGPAGQIAMMHRVLVDERRWFSEARFLHALNFCMVLPGPEAQQLATYLGWLMHRTRGGLVAGTLFVLPGAAVLMALSWIYVLWGDIAIVGGLLFGLKSAVLAIVAEAVGRVGRRAIRSPSAAVIAMLSFAALFAFAVPFPLVIVAAALAGLAVDRLGLSSGPAVGRHDPEGNAEEPVPAHVRPDSARALKTAAIWLPAWLAPVAATDWWLGPDNVLSRLALFFSEVAVVSFGGAYAVLAYVGQRAVTVYHWLRADEMLAGLGLAETTPGPLIMVVQHVGFLAGYRTPGSLPPLLAGTVAGLLVTWVTFAPCFLWVFLGAPYAEAMRGIRWLDAALSAVTAAVVGVIANLGLWFAIHTLFRETIPLRSGPLALDLPLPAAMDAAALTLAALGALCLFRLRLGVAASLSICALAGMATRLAGLAA